MKPSFVTGALVGYVLGARAGRDRYEQIVAIARRVAGSQTIQATAGVLQAQAADAALRTKDEVLARVPLLRSVLPNDQAGSTGRPADGYRRRR